MESLVTHLIGELHIKYGLLFVKNSVGAFWQKSLVDASQKLVFSTFGKWKIDFLFKEDENSLWRHCLPLQDTHMCTIWDHYQRLFVGYGHNQAHFTKKTLFLFWKNHEKTMEAPPVQISC